MTQQAVTRQVVTQPARKAMSNPARRRTRVREALGVRNGDLCGCGLQPTRRLAGRRRHYVNGAETGQACITGGHSARPEVADSRETLPRVNVLLGVYAPCGVLRLGSTPGGGTDHSERGRS